MWANLARRGNRDEHPELDQAIDMMAAQCLHALQYRERVLRLSSNMYGQRRPMDDELFTASYLVDIVDFICNVANGLEEMSNLNVPI